MKTLTESIKPEKMIASMLLHMYLFLHYCDSRYRHSLTYCCLLLYVNRQQKDSSKTIKCTYVINVTANICFMNLFSLFKCACEVYS